MGFTLDLLPTQRKSGEIHPNGQSLNISQMFNGARLPCLGQTFLDGAPRWEGGDPWPGSFPHGPAS